MCVCVCVCVAHAHDIECDHESHSDLSVVKESDPSKLSCLPTLARADISPSIQRVDIGSIASYAFDDCFVLQVLI